MKGIKYISVADPGCLSRIPDPNFSDSGPNFSDFFHPGSELFHPGSMVKKILDRICIKEFKYLTRKIVFKLSEI